MQYWYRGHEIMCNDAGATIVKNSLSFDDCMDAERYIDEHFLNNDYRRMTATYWLYH